jgi:biopolymer transport protein ExbD
MAVQLRQSSVTSAINMTPIIDVVFLLLIFFLVTSQFEQMERNLDVELPSASEAQPLLATPQEFFVDVDSNGRFSIDGRICTVDRVEALLSAARRESPALSVMIRIDRRTQFDHFNVIINMCKKLNISEYKYATEGQ